MCSGADEHCEGQDVSEALVIAGDPRAGNLGAQDALGMTEQQGRSRVDIQLGCIEICQSSQLLSLIHISYARRVTNSSTSWRKVAEWVSRSRRTVSLWAMSG